jgi:Family of unknown function (DUF6343)
MRDEREETQDRTGQGRNSVVDRTDFSAGLPDHHDPTAGFGGAPPVYSALTLRLILATFGFVVCIAGALAGLVVAHSAALVVILVIFAAVAAVDIAVILRRKRRGEPG